VETVHTVGSVESGVSEESGEVVESEEG
jgi:hypothetical protein